MWLRRPPHPTLVLEKNINFSFFWGEGELVAGASLIRHSYSLWFALFVALFMLCCGCFFMVHVILSLPSFCPHLANGKKRAEGGQWQYHMNHEKKTQQGKKRQKIRTKFINCKIISSFIHLGEGILGTSLPVHLQNLSAALVSWRGMQGGGVSGALHFLKG